MTKFYREKHNVEWAAEYREIAKGVKMFSGRQTLVDVDADVLELDEKFKLARLGKQQSIAGLYYRFIVDRSYFDINVCRDIQGVMTGTALVFARFRRGQFVGEETWPVDHDYWKALASKIDAALRAWPTPSVQDAPPLGVMFFQVHTDVWHEKNLQSGDFVNDWGYRLKLGRSLSLRAAPPSKRWKSAAIENPNGLLMDTNFFAVARAMARVRDDGVQLIRIPTLRGPQNDGPDTFLYSDRSYQFEFSADHRLSTGIVTDTWVANFFDGHRRAPALDPERRSEIMEIIAEALYAWPPEQEDEDETPVNRVVFIDVKGSNIAF
jgi:hypothetical protein